MKRDRKGDPVVMVHRWSQPSLSCLPCRQKKRRCDRTRPCSSCALRSIPCEYEHSPEGISGGPPSNDAAVPPAAAVTRPSEPASCNHEETLERVRRLEAAVFHGQGQHPAVAKMTPQHRAASSYHTLFGSHMASSEADEAAAATAYVAHAAGQLPPRGQARQLFSHYVEGMHPTIGVLHIPSAKALLEQTLDGILAGDEPDLTNLLLLYTLFAGAALVWTPQLLDSLNSTQADARAAFRAYKDLAVSILDNSHRPIQPSTNALAAIGTLAHVIASADNDSSSAHVLRMRCMLMARAMQVHRLDTAKSIEERRTKGCDMVEVEVQRRVWWNMVASDWLNAFSGGPQEGAYIFHPEHMRVNYPSNADDSSITPSATPHDLPLTTPTSMTTFIYRLHLASLCRHVVDVSPPDDAPDPDYDALLALDARFRRLLDRLPPFLRLDPASLRAAEPVLSRYPDLAWQRIALHSSAHARLCRLHRPYHLLAHPAGDADPRAEHSRRACVQSAQRVLELRRALDDVAAPSSSSRQEHPPSGSSVARIRPARFRAVANHAYIAALVLAADVSLDPGAPGSGERRARVLAACEALEGEASEGAGAVMEGMRRSMLALLAGVQRPGGGEAEGDDRGDGGSRPAAEAAGLPGDGKMGEGDSDLLWSEFLAVAPELEAPQWNLFLEDVDFNF